MAWTPTREEDLRSLDCRVAVGHARFDQGVGQGVKDLHRRRRAIEVDSAQLYRAGSGDQKLHDVVNVSDAPNPHDWNPDRLGGLIDGPQSNWLDGWSAQPAHDITQERPPSPPVNRHA